jgi:glycosyltransferase involved in cell wall biosynthesis
MRVLFINRPKDAWIGGDYIQMEKTANELRKLGVEVDIEDNPLPSPALKMYLYDIIHVWHFSMEWSKYAVWASVSKKLPTVVSMIYHESDQYIPYPNQQIMADQVDGMIFMTEGEKGRVRRHLELDESKTIVIPNGIDKHWFDKYRKGSYLLTVGRIEPSKGQFAVAKVANKMGLKYRCVGENKDPYYAELVRLEGAEMVGKVEDIHKLKEIYQHCSVYVLASRAELLPLTVMEAGAQGKQIILSNHCEWKVPAEYVEWNNEKEIQKAIEKQLAKGENKELKAMLKDMSWSSVGKQVKEYYEEILRRRNGAIKLKTDSGVEFLA